MADDTDTAPNNISNAPCSAPMPIQPKSHGRTKKKTRRHSQADVAAAAEDHVALVDRRRSAQTTTEEPDEGKDQKQNNGSCNDKDKGNLAPSMLGGKVEIIEVKTEDGGTRRVPKLRKGLLVSYKSADGVMDALILDVHLDDLLEPYYTIKLPDGREKQTDNAHIELPSGVEKTNKMDTDNATTDENSDLRAAATELKNFQYQPIRSRNDKKIDTKPPTRQNYATREPSKSLKRQLSRRSNTSSIDPPGMDISARTDELDHSKSIQELLNSKVVPFGEDEIDSWAVGAIAITNDDDIPEVINVTPRPDIRFRRSATSGSNLSSLDILESAYTEADNEQVLIELQNALFELSKIDSNLDPTARDAKASHKPYVSKSRSATLNTKLPSTTTKHVSRQKTCPIRSRAPSSSEEEKKKRLDQERLFLERLEKEKRISRQKLAREKAAIEKEDRSKISRGSSRGSELLSDVDSSKDVSGMRRIKSMSKLSEILSRKK